MSTISYLDTMLRAEPSATLAKITVILAMTGLTAVVLRRAAAAVRHVVWLAGLVSAASMMMLAPIAPAIVLPVARDPSPAAATAGPPIDNVVVARRASSSVPNTGASSGVRTANASTPMTRAGARMATVGRALAHMLSSMLSPGGLFALWAIGAAVVLGRSLIGHIVVARLVRGARARTDPDLSAASERLGARRVRLFVTERITTPITAGLRRPVVLLPMSAEEWNAERRRIVFVHEVAHIIRGDYAAQAVATVAAAVLWFHPLAWLAVVRLKAEAEHAADDVVLSTGTTGVTYASHLLELARTATPMRLSAAVSVGVVRSSRVERRFLAILDERRLRRGLGWRTIGAAALVSTVVLSPLAGLRTVARAMTPPAYQTPPAPPGTPRTSVGAAAPPAQVLQPPRPGHAMRSDIDSIVERSISAVPGARLHLSLPTGGAIAVHGWDSSRIRVRAVLGGEDWRDARIDLTRDGRDATLSSRFSNGGTHNTELSFEIWVPLETDLDVSSAGGSVAINHVSGLFRGRTGGGSIDIRNGGGEADLYTGGGEITVADSHLDGTIRTGWGRVRIENNTGDLRGLTNGPPALRSAPPTRILSASDVTVTNRTMGCASVSVGDRSYQKGRFSISKDGGDIHLALAPAGWAMSTAGGRIVVDSTVGGIVAVTGGGDVELGAASADATVSTGAGDVSIRVVGAPAAPHNVNVCDGFGHVTLDLPRDLDATIELETAYTDNAPRPSTIESDFDLSRSETREWDDRFGTPRKFVRAVGKIGAGTSVIRVSTVNGDIVLHRR